MIAVLWKVDQARSSVHKPAQTEAFRLFDLPSELRLLVYHSMDLRAPGYLSQEHLRHLTEGRVIGSTRVLDACKRLRREMLQEFLLQNILRLDGWQPKAFDIFQEHLSLDIYQNIRNVSIAVKACDADVQPEEWGKKTTSYHYSRKAMNACPNIRKIFFKFVWPRNPSWDDETSQAIIEFWQSVEELRVAAIALQNLRCIVLHITYEGEYIAELSEHILPATARDMGIELLSQLAAQRPDCRHELRVEALWRARERKESLKLVKASRSCGKITTGL